MYVTSFVCFPATSFLSDFEVFCKKKRIAHPGQDLNPGPYVCEASLLPFCHGHFIQKMTKICGLILQISTFSVRISCFISIFVYLFATLEFMAIRHFSPVDISPLWMFLPATDTKDKKNFLYQFH